MPSIGANCHELRINDKSKTWRIAYFIDKDAIVILEVFAKKTQKTPTEVIDRRAKITVIQKMRPIMEHQKRKQLEEKGFRVGSAADFLALSPEEETYIEIRLEISELIKSQRRKRSWTQEQLARAIGSSQSRVAKMETGEQSTSLDLMIKTLLRLGISKNQIGNLLTGNLKPDLGPA